jgi:CdiI immunity protein
MKSWDALETLLGGYLHEDFADLHGSAWGAVEDFARDEHDYAPQLRRQITELISASPSESDLEGALVGLGLNYLPTADRWESHRIWLLAVADRVDEILHSSPAA